MTFTIIDSITNQILGLIDVDTRDDRNEHTGRAAVHKFRRTAAENKRDLPQVIHALQLRNQDMQP